MAVSKFGYFLVYSFAFILYGSIITGMGPIIPYFSKATGKSQTSFSFIFFVRAIGYVFGGSLIKYLTRNFDTHKIFMGVQLVGGISFIMSSLSLTNFNLGICMFVGAACCCMINVVSNMCVLKLFAGQNQDYWIQLLHLIFGLGGLVGPFIVIQFQQKSFLVIGILFFFSIPLFYFLKSPQSRDSVRKSVMIQPISRKAQILTCILFLMYIGQEVGFGSWIPTYAVVEKITTPQGASILGSIFWISNTIFRIVLLYVKGKISDRLRLLLAGMVGTSIIILIALFFGFKYFAAYGGSILIGMFLASMFALFLTLPGEFGLKLTHNNTANFMMSASMGEGALTMPIGYAMGMFGPSMLFVLMFIFSVVMYWVFNNLMATLQQDSLNKSPLNQKLVDNDRSELSEEVLPF